MVNILTHFTIFENHKKLKTGWKSVGFMILKLMIYIHQLYMQTSCYSKTMTNNLFV